MSEKKSSTTTTRDDRARNWLFVLYPDSAPADWRDKLDEHHIQWCESPLHDKDVNADGEPKKAHKHILLVFDGKKSFSQVSELTKSVNATIPIKCQSTKGTVRYMVHMDNPEKAQYSTADIIGHGGFDPADCLKATATNRYYAIMDMMQYVRKHNITDYCQLMEYAAEERPDDWFPLLCDSCSFVLTSYINSRRNFCLEEARRTAYMEATADPSAGASED